MSGPLICRVAATASAVLILNTAPCLANAEAGRRSDTVYAPCYAPAGVDTTGWQVHRLVSVDGWHFFFRAPPTFRLDPKARFHEGGELYVDGDRQIVNGWGYVCAPDRPTPECSECIDTIAGHPFVLTSSYENGLFHLAATRISNASAPSVGGFRTSSLHLTSPDSSDQRLLFTILHTLQERSRISTGGVLFLGGHELRAPFVFTCPDGRLAVNGHWMPDLIPATTRQPNASAELEARRTIAARLQVQRDSLLANGAGWQKAQTILRATVLRSPYVKSVQLETRSDSLITNFAIVWEFGYNHTAFGRKGPPVTMGGGKSFEQDWQFWTARLDYLKGLMDGGKALFLLGGGCEYVVNPSDAARALEAARRIAEGRSLQGRERQILPDDVLDQLRHPLALEEAE